MGLVLKLHYGEDFYVEDTQVRVVGVSADSFTLQADGDPVKITIDFEVEMFDDVFISASDRPEEGVAKVVINAPRRIKVLLGELYRNPKPKAIDAYLFDDSPAMRARREMERAR
jgi:sRNA-binding carbon storage regulator CsrA